MFFTVCHGVCPRTPELESAAISTLSTSVEITSSEDALVEGLCPSICIGSTIGKKDGVAAWASPSSSWRKEGGVIFRCPGHVFFFSFPVLTALMNAEVNTFDSQEICAPISPHGMTAWPLGHRARLRGERGGCYTPSPTHVFSQR